MSHLPSIVIVNPSGLVTGPLITARATARLLKGLANVVLVLPEGHMIGERALQDFARVETISLVNLSRRKANLLGYIPALVKGSMQLRRLLRSLPGATLCLNDFYLMHGFMLRLMGYRGQIISWVRCDPRKLLGRVAAPLLWLSHLSANQTIVVSRYIKAMLPFSKSVLLYDAYSGPEPRSSAPNEGVKRFVFIGNYIQGKGQDVALAAFASVCEQMPEAQLHFYGDTLGLSKNAHTLATLKQHAQPLGDRVMFHGFVEDASDALSGAFAAINASNTESFSLTVLEASGYGVPVIATACGGPQEIIDDEKTGFLVPVADAEQIAARMLQLARDPALAAQMGQAGAALVAERFSPEQFRTQLLALIAD